MTAHIALVEHEGTLFGIAYRMLGSVTEAEDAVQETFLRYSAAQAGTITEPRAWLTTVVSRVCIDRLRSAQRRRETYVGPWLPEPLLVDDDDPADRVAMAESLSLAFLVVLESLSPQERVAFVLHDVFGLPFDEVAEVLGKSSAAVRQLASRARRHVQERRPRFEADPQARERVAEAFLAACAGGRLEDVLALLAPDVVLTSDGGGRVSAARRPVVGADAVARFLTGLLRQAGGRLRVRRLLVNGSPGAVLEVDGYEPTVVALDIADGRVAAVSMVRNPDKLRGLRRG